MLEPKKYMNLPVVILNAVSSLSVFLSIIGLIVEFTAYKNSFVVKAGQIIDLYFLVDFILRLISFPAKKYFFKDYGWLDLLGVLPCLSILSGISPLGPVIMASGYYGLTGMLRMFRLMRIFNLVRLANNHSEHIGRRMKKITSPVLIFDVLFMIGSGYYMEATFIESNPIFYNNAMAAMISIMIFSVLFVNVRIRSILKKDVKIMSLVIDSINAGEYALLKHEAAGCKEDVDSAEDELDIMMRLTSGLIGRMEESETMKYIFYPDTADNQSGLSNSLEKIEGMLKNKSIVDDDYVKKIAGSTSLHTVKLSAKMIMDILKNNGK
jgi:hypothetical protein